MHRANAYKDELKNHSLARLASNVDRTNGSTTGFTQGGLACQILMEDYDEFRIDHRDSIGHYLSIASKAWTIFVALEEYLTLRNSGLMELVENDSHWSTRAIRSTSLLAELVRVFRENDNLASCTRT